MPNPFFNALGGGKQPNIMQMLNQLKQNPAQFLMKNKFNVPQNMLNNPQEIINHLVSTGQVSQESYNRAYNIARQFGSK